MAENWRQTVTNVSEHLFPGISYYNPPVDDYFIKLGNEIVSNLPLQMSLYFNVIFFPIWVIVTLLMLQIKFSCLSMLYQIIILVVVFVVIFIEAIRLYLGYVGNLLEKIPELAGFWILSVLLQAPLQLFLLLNGSLHSSVLEKVVQTIMALFLIVQLFTGYKALQDAARHSAEQFHITQFKMPGFPSNLELRTKSD
ncbi:transmembrane protein 17-like [Lycorma delicatula]|uniref:transmembrane protein 17-like n=1 Tax=Lycorma delicatula TaxID=130591 RepID=UPI003F516997